MHQGALRDTSSEETQEINVKLTAQASVNQHQVGRNTNKKRKQEKAYFISRRGTRKKHGTAGHLIRAKRSCYNVF